MVEFQGYYQRNSNIDEGLLFALKPCACHGFLLKLHWERDARHGYLLRRLGRVKFCNGMAFQV